MSVLTDRHIGAQQFSTLANKLKGTLDTSIWTSFGSSQYYAANLCICLFISKGILCHYAPKIHKVYANTKASLKSIHPYLEWNFHNSIFVATTFNLGPTTITLDYTDNGNFTSGMCCITVVGNFNPVLRGHLILFNLGLIIQFLLDATKLIPLPSSSMETSLFLHWRKNCLLLNILQEVSLDWLRMDAAQKGF
jgi:hypothetical protein